MEHEDKALGAVTAMCGATKTALGGSGDVWQKRRLSQTARLGNSQHIGSGVTLLVDQVKNSISRRGVTRMSLSSCG
jgi:hypothetical protein